jgi:hypothetical protein
MAFLDSSTQRGGQAFVKIACGGDENVRPLLFFSEVALSSIVGRVSTVKKNF